MPRRILVSRHAWQRMILRGISAGEVSDAIRKGTKRTQGGKIVATYLYFEVVYIVRRKTIYVITVQPRW